MFQKNDKIVYGSTGVCEIADIVDGSEVNCVSGKAYYVIKPVFEECRIYTPVDSAVRMRKLVSRKEIDALIDKIPEIIPKPFFARSVQQLNEYYESAIKVRECSELLELLISIYEKKRLVEERKQKFGQLDERYLKKVKKLLYTEFSVVMNLEYRNVESYVEGIIKNKPR